MTEDLTICGQYLDADDDVALCGAPAVVVVEFTDDADTVNPTWQVGACAAHRAMMTGDKACHARVVRRYDKVSA